jgi:hypothetical protein
VQGDDDLGCLQGKALAGAGVEAVAKGADTRAAVSAAKSRTLFVRGRVKRSVWGIGKERREKRVKESIHRSDRG